MNQNIYGATISGSGKVVIVLNSHELIINSSEYKSINDRPTFETDLGENSSTAKRVLIAEDSITIRSMLKNFVENAGYEVTAAVDGLEAFNLLKRNSFDLVVSDIEMPRMNGFELTQRIREDYDLKNLPVILVTALESKEDQKKGLDAGANAYIVKSSFEKSNLTDTIKRLI
ncbi:MAG: response regulator [Bacteroidales bacterium]